MKTKIFPILLSAVALAGFSACSDDWNSESEAQGQLKLSALGVEVDGAETIVADKGSTQKAPARVASRATIDLSNFIVTVEDSKGREVQTWAYKDLTDQLPTFNAGDYKVTVRSHDVEGAAWNAPYYAGEEPFTITAGQVTVVNTVVCKLSNIRVSVAYTDRLLKAFDNPDEVSVKITSQGENSLTFKPSEARSGYFEALADLQTLRIDFSAYINGHHETFTKTIDNVAKGQHRKITLGLTSNDNLPPEELGTITNDGNGISVNTDVVEDEPIESDYPWYEDNTGDSDRPGNEDFDDPVGPDDPDTPKISFTSSTLDLENVNNAHDWEEGGTKSEAKVTINAVNGMAHLYVEIISDGLTADVLESVGLSSSFDLAYPGNLEEGVAGLGFPYGSGVIGNTQVEFDITQFVPLLNIYPGTSNFKITVVDQASPANTKELLLKFKS